MPKDSTNPLRVILTGLCLLLPAAVQLAPQQAHAAEKPAVITGVVRDEDGQGLVGATVVIQCTCMQSERRTTTNDLGLYAFKKLPPGLYTVQVFYEATEVIREIRVERGGRESLNATVSGAGEVIIIDDIGPPVERTPAPTDDTNRELLDKLPGADATGDAVKSAVDKNPLGDSKAGGPAFIISDSASNGYTLDGGSGTDPTTGQVAIPIVREFVDSVQTQVGGYDAEYGGVTGGQITVRRRSGSNVHRGSARFAYTPRLARPRFVVQTDAAVRAIEVPDYSMLGVIAASGPIVEDRLWYSGGIMVVGGQSSLIQTFHAREDLDGSGGYEDCPYENGTKDCASGGNYIATRKIAEQRYRLPAVRLQAFGGLDFAINRNHRLGLTVRATPSFVRRSYRRPTSASTLDPDALGASPTADPLGGASITANGILDGNFGWDRTNAFQTALTYQGRMLNDKLEVDASLAFLQTAYDEGWRLDNPELKNQTASELRDGNGRNLFDLVQTEPAVSRPVREACNDTDLPGMTCPTYSWVAGGLGLYSRDRARRAEGALSFTHFFHGAGSHQLKYGSQIEHLERQRMLKFSGRNDASFYEEGCGPGEKDGGEYCYNPSTGEYRLNTSTRVNNNRLVLIDGNNPNSRQTRGYGRIRSEEGELRAIAGPTGNGARADAYRGKVSTQNYGVYLQDRWAVLSNLYLNGGVRWQIQDMRDVLGDRAIFVWDSVAPRASIVYDWTDEGKSRLYANYGWFYQNLPLSLLNRVYGGQVTVQRQFDYNTCEGETSPASGLPMESGGQPTEWCPDAGGSTTGLLPGATVPGLRGQYEQQLQIGYEHEIVEDLTVGVSWIHTDLQRAVEDVSTNGGLDFIIANPGTPVAGADITRQQERCEDLSDQLDRLDPEGPDSVRARRSEVARDLQRCEFLVHAYENVGSMFTKPVKNIDAFTLKVTKRFAKNWFVQASYTYSRSIGNYDGFVDPVSGAINLGSSVQYDLPEFVRNSFGPLSYDSPHRVKLDGAYVFDLKKAGALTVGASFRMKSGYPTSIKADHNRYRFAFPIYVLPRGAGGRLEANHQVNLNVQYAYPLPKSLVLVAGARLFNVANSKAVLRTDEVYSFQTTRPIAGGELSDLKHAKIQNPGNPTEFFQREILQPQGNYGTEAAFQTPLAGQFELQLLF